MLCFPFSFAILFITCNSFELSEEKMNDASRELLDKLDWFRLRSKIKYTADLETKIVSSRITVHEIMTLWYHASQ